MGLGNYLPLAISNALVPRIPRRRQRFASAATWAQAEAASVGYRSAPITFPAIGVLRAHALTGNKTAFVAAREPCDGPVSVVDFVCPDDRAGFAGHYSTYRGLVIATNRRKA